MFKICVSWEGISISVYTFSLHDAGACMFRYCFPIYINFYEYCFRYIDTHLHLARTRANAQPSVLLSVSNGETCYNTSTSIPID